jgi:gliding motility-associated-like protein
VEFEVIQPLCYGDTGFITINTLVGLAPITVHWVHADQGLTGTESINSNPGSAELSLTVSGTYFLEVKSINGLSVFDTIAISDIPPLVVSLTVPADQFGYSVPCYGDPSATAISNLDEIGTPPYNYKWSNGSDADTLSMLGAGIYSLTVTDANGCTTSASTAVTEPDLMEYMVDSMNISCNAAQDGSISLSGVTGGVSPWLTSLNGQSFSEVFSYGSLAPGEYQLFIMDQNGCMAEENILIEEPEAWSISLGMDTSVVLGNSVDLEINFLGMPTGMVQTQWSDGLCANCFSRNIIPATTTTFSVTAIDENGCTDKDDIHVRVTIDRSLYIPNVFSPNGDQINDLFTLHAGAGLEEIEIINIFDRWGNLVFQSTHFHPDDLSGAWDGTMNGKYLNPGVYVYTLTAVFLDGIKEQRYGDVSLIR